MKHIKLYEEFLKESIENKVRAQLIQFLHEGVRMSRSESINESSKYPELKRLLDDAQKEGKTLLIAEFVPEIESLMDKFSKSGQSGASAPFTAGAIIDTIKKMFAHEPLGEGIMGTDDEWSDRSVYEDAEEGTGIFQNMRLSSVFKDGKEGKPYYIDAIVFTPEDKNYSFTGGVMLSEGSKETISSSQFIKSFPFAPKTFKITVKEKEYRKLKDGSLVEEDGGGWWESWLADPTQLDNVWEYYDKKKPKK